MPLGPDLHRGILQGVRPENVVHALTGGLSGYRRLHVRVTCRVEEWSLQVWGRCRRLSEHHRADLDFDVTASQLTREDVRPLARTDSAVRQPWGWR